MAVDRLITASGRRQTRAVAWLGRQWQL